MVVSFLLVEAIKQRLDVHPSVIQLLSQVLKDEWKSVRQREKLSEWCQSLGGVMNFHVFRESRIVLICFMSHLDHESRNCNLQGKEL